MELDRSIIDEQLPGWSNADVQQHRAVYELVVSNRAQMERDVMMTEAQDPFAIVVHCARFPAEVIFGQIKEQGRLFDVSSRGAATAKEFVGSATYAAHHLKKDGHAVHPHILAILVHECVRAGACRVSAGAQMYNVPNELKLGTLENTVWPSGLALINVPESQELPICDRMHARRTALHLLIESSPVLEMVRKGEIVIAESFLENATGKVRYLSFITGDNKNAGLDAKTLIETANGKPLAGEQANHPALKALAELVLGNERFVRHFRAPVPTEFIFSACSDARSAMYVSFAAPFGLIETVRNAGNMVTPTLLDSMAISAREALEHRDRAYVGIITHSRCGALKATLGAVQNNLFPDKLSENDRAIVSNLLPRIAQTNYLKDHPHPEKSDEHGLVLAERSATMALRELMTSTHPAASYLREKSAEGRIAFVSGTFWMKTGLVKFGPVVNGKK